MINCSVVVNAPLRPSLSVLELDIITVICLTITTIYSFILNSISRLVLSVQGIVVGCKTFGSENEGHSIKILNEGNEELLASIYSPSILHK